MVTQIVGRGGYSLSWCFSIRATSLSHHLSVKKREGGGGVSRLRGIGNCSRELKEKILSRRRCGWINKERIIVKGDCVRCTAVVTLLRVDNGNYDSSKFRWCRGGNIKLKWLARNPKSNKTLNRWNYRRGGVESCSLCSIMNVSIRVAMVLQFLKKSFAYIILIKRGIKRGECLQPLVTVLSYFNIGSCFIHFLPIAL